MDRVQSILQLIVALTQLEEQDLLHVWTLVHAVKNQGAEVAQLQPHADISQVPLPPTK